LCTNPVSESPEQNVLEEIEADSYLPNGDQVEVEMCHGDDIESTAVSTLHRVRFCKLFLCKVDKSLNAHSN